MSETPTQNPNLAAVGIALNKVKVVSVASLVIRRTSETSTTMTVASKLKMTKPP